MNSLILAVALAVPSGPPNVILIMTDDQGYGDLANNPVLRTPNIDAMAERSASLETFYVSPVCTPTRAALMTGMYPQRTTAIDTFIGRAMLEPEEITLAEILRENGYATGIFGKWHLGDCYPMRAMDQGFDESLVHRGGGIGQSSDPEGGERRYADPVLCHNGERAEMTGYCTDIYFDAAIAWMTLEHKANRPFFAYIPTNAPHTPLGEVPEDPYGYYKSQDLSIDAFPNDAGHPLQQTNSEDNLARIFAMIENIDDNVGKLFSALDEHALADNTVVIYMHDNGPNSRRYVRGLRGMKSEVHEGGVRSPLFVHWPARLEPGPIKSPIGAHIDILPTILDACDIDLPEGHEIDGRSLLPALRGEAWDQPSRPLIIQAHRGDAPVRYHNMMVREGHWKLVNPSGFGRETPEGEPRFELYDLDADPYEQHNLASDHPEQVERLRAAYDAWFEDVGALDPSNYDPPRIVIGADESPRTVLTRQDWRRLIGGQEWATKWSGYWLVRIVDEGSYRIRVRVIDDPESVELRIGAVSFTGFIEPGSTDIVFESVRLPLGEHRLEAICRDGDEAFGGYQVIIDRLRQ